MAIRPVFISTDNEHAFVREEEIEFKWSPGMSKSQKQKSIQSLHEAALEKRDMLGITNILEISSKSEESLGIALSAFNLHYTSADGKSISVECIFQGAKVFKNGGPYTELLEMSSREAKKYDKLQTSGKLLYFMRKNEKWELEPKTLFYDWIYLNTLRSNVELAEQITEYNAFTDIEFNPKKSINCQAASVALFVSLSRAKLLDIVLESKESFIHFLVSQQSRDMSKLF